MEAEKQNSQVPFTPAQMRLRDIMQNSLIGDATGAIIKHCYYWITLKVDANDGQTF